jgi:hypothetical protein
MGFENCAPSMNSPSDRDERTVLLARAFDRAWNGYYRPGRIVTIPQGIARSSLATHLIELAKAGVRDEDALAESGLQHLIAITPKPWGQLRIESAGARFLRSWRVRIDGRRSQSD